MIPNSMNKISKKLVKSYVRKLYLRTFLPPIFIFDIPCYKIFIYLILVYPNDSIETSLDVIRDLDELMK